MKDGGSPGGWVAARRRSPSEAEPGVRELADHGSSGLHVLHVLDHSVPLHSGYAFRSLAILKEQRALGWRTSHLTGPRQGGNGELAEDVGGWHFHRTPVPRGAAGFPLGAAWRTATALARRLEPLARQLRPDVLHAHSPALNGVAALMVGRRLRLPVVYEVRALWEDAAVSQGATRAGSLRYRLTRALESWVLRRVDAVTTICEGLRTELIRRGLRPGQVTVVPNAVDVERFALGSSPDPGLRSALGLDGHHVLGFIGSFYAYEGLDVLLRALPALLRTDPDVRVLLVGDGPEGPRLKGLADELGVAANVAFTGRVPHTEVERYYDQIDVLVYPRRSLRVTEMVTPLKPLEAMAQGRALIVSDVGGHRELVEDGVTGVFFRADDPGDLARTAHEFLASREHWPKLRAAARRFVETQRTWPVSVGRYRSVYARVNAAGGRS